LALETPGAFGCSRLADPSRHDIINMTLENGTGCIFRCTAFKLAQKFDLIVAGKTFI
jgi:hypothetical protein